MVRPLLVLIAGLGATAVACGGERRETSNREATGFEQVEQTTIPDDCPPEWPGPWTTCPEADWVEKVARRAGYRISGETGSALIAEGNGRSFYIWTTPAATAEEIERAGKNEDWQPFGRVDGVQVYGDESVWRSWMGERLTIWLQAGPTKDSRLPSLTEMESLVRASMTVPAPRKTAFLDFWIAGA